MMPSSNAARPNVLLLGSGGRESALAWKLKQSPALGKLHVCPGNEGMRPWAECVPGLSLDDHSAIAEWCKRNQINLVVVGPENPLVAGIVDCLKRHGIPVFGPDKLAARLEGSKRWAKDFMSRHHIPTAAYKSFTNPDDALEWADSRPWSIVLKADGLAAGKGVVLPDTREETENCIRDMLSGNPFGDAGSCVVIEERLEGPEISLFALCDGRDALRLAPAQDHKRIFDGDRGPNTGGMGAHAPSQHATAVLLERIQREILIPTLRGMELEGCSYSGTLFIGLMLCADGPKVIEYNCRFGDPESQAVLALMDEDLLEVLWQIANGEKLGRTRACKNKSGSAVCVVAASEGYPGSSPKGRSIKGLDSLKESRVFHAGTTLDQGVFKTAGGRVLSLVATGPDLETARKLVYKDMEGIHFEGIQFRTDIAAGNHSRGDS